jgi:hypothetical protein
VSFKIKNQAAWLGQIALILLNATLPVLFNQIKYYSFYLLKPL